MTAYAEVIPIGNESNDLYYRVGGGIDFALPPVSDTTTIRLDSDADLGLGNSCSAFNPALSIRNSINDLKDSIDNLEQSIVASATGSLIQLPMYFLAQANPTAYNLLNNGLLSAHHQLDISVKSCETIKNEIANGQNPYQDWGTISVNDQWKKHLSFVSSGNEDINQTKKEIGIHNGEDGLPWVQGKKDNDSSTHAGGKNQPPIHVIADTVKAGYNTLLNRDLQSEDNAPNTSSNTALIHEFPNPKSAVTWITNVVGDQIITTCTDNSCKKSQSSFVGHGLLPWVTSCQFNEENCADTIRNKLGQLVNGNETISKDTLKKVSADGIIISPDVIATIRQMDAAQQVIIINKLSLEVAMQRAIDKAFIAKNILETGKQIPVISSNHPAQISINQAITNLDNDIRSLAFEGEIRKQAMSNTLSEVMKYGNQQEHNAMRVSPASSSSPLMENGALAANKEK